MSKLLPLLSTREIGGLVSLVDRGRLQDAELETRALLNAHSDAGILWKILGVALLRQGKDALPALVNAARYLPNDAETHSNLGAALRDRRQWAEAAPSFIRALEIAPNDVATLLDAADTFKALGNLQEAVPLYEKALRRDPGLTPARNNLGNVLLELGQSEAALACYRQALRLEPDNAQITCNIGNALRCLARHDEAATFTQRAIALDPGLSVAHNNLGLVLAAQGQRAAAIASYRQALILNPNYPEALNNVGNVLRDLGARRDAWSYYKQAIELDPLRAESHCNLATILLELRRHDEAAASCSRALSLQPSHVAAHITMAAICRGLGRSAEAESCCQQALALDAGSAEALSLMGELRADRGHFSDAEDLFNRAIAIDRNFPFPLFSIAANRKMTLDDTAWLKSTQELLTQPLNLRNEISLRYALGKYFDDVRHYDEAFGHYRRANELTQRYGVAYDARRVSDQVDAITGLFDGESLERLKSAGNASGRPVFIVGMPRSGTTLTEQILASHPAVFGAGELPFWQTALAKFRSAERDHTGSGVSHIAETARSYLANLAQLAADAERVIDKMPQNFKALGLIHATFPNAKIIHLRRHPIDTCLSIYFHYFSHLHPYAADLENLAHYYSEYMRLTDHWRTVLPHSALLEVPYEALIADQEVWSRRMVQFIGLPWDSRCLNFHETDRVVTTLSKWQVRQQIHAASDGRWKHYEKFLGPLRRLVQTAQPARPTP